MLAPQRASLEALSDPDLAHAIASAAPGEALAYEEELYRRFAPRVRLYGLKHLRDADAAQDLAQQVLLVTITRLRAGEVRNTAEIASFVLGTSRLMSKNLLRRERRREALGERWRHLAATATTPDTTRQDLDRLERCLRGLAVRDRSVLVLTFYGEKAAPDIAAALGMTAGAVRVTRHRALDRLRQCVGSGGAP